VDEILAGKTIHAAGGIVVRKGARPLVAVVQRSKDDHWVLPRGKLKRAEPPIVGAEREVVEETGHRVKVREFLGAITYRARGRPKVVQFWHMSAAKKPSHDLMKDIAAVDWLPLAAAIRRLSYPLEKLFLDNVGRQAISARKRSARRKKRAAKSHAAKSGNHKRRTEKPKHKVRPVSKPRRPVSKKKRLSAAVHAAASTARAAVRNAAPHRRRSMLQRVLGSFSR
jgi:8-oxo-dGTP diphosphatase